MQSLLDGKGNEHGHPSKTNSRNESKPLVEEEGNASGQDREASAADRESVMKSQF